MNQSSIFVQPERLFILVARCFSFGCKTTYSFYACRRYVICFIVISHKTAIFAENTNTLAMAGTYSQLHIQLVFAVKAHQSSLIRREWKDETEKYICGIVSNHNCKALAIYCNPDHTHILIGIRPTTQISDLVREIKGASSKFIHERFDKNKHFQWQSGYGVFSYSYSQIDQVYRYILNQEEHHRKRTFREEYMDMLNKMGVVFEIQYLFDGMQ